jgi:hypothetical protein
MLRYVWLVGLCFGCAEFDHVDTGDHHFHERPETFSPKDVSIPSGTLSKAEVAQQVPSNLSISKSLKNYLVSHNPRSVILKMSLPYYSVRVSDHIFKAMPQTHLRERVAVWVDLCSQVAGVLSRSSTYSNPGKVDVVSALPPLPVEVIISRGLQSTPATIGLGQ